MVDTYKMKHCDKYDKFMKRSTEYKLVTSTLPLDFGPDLLRERAMMEIEQQFDGQEK